MTLRVRLAERDADAFMAVLPGELTLRVYADGDSEPMVGPPVLSVEADPSAREANGWVPAVALADALTPHLA